MGVVKLGFNRHKRYQKEESSAIVSVVLEYLEDSNVDDLFDSGSELSVTSFVNLPSDVPLQADENHDHEVLDRRVPWVEKAAQDIWTTMGFPCCN